MSESKKHRRSRWLRLERLESRSLLAGGIFDFTMRDGGDGRQERDRDRPSHVDQRSTHDHGRGEHVILNRDRTDQGRGHIGRAGDGRHSVFGDRLGSMEMRGDILSHLNGHDQDIPERIVPEPIQRSVSTPLNESIGNPITNSFAPPLRVNSQPITFLVASPIRSQATPQVSAEEPLAGPRSNEVQLTSLPDTLPDREQSLDEDAAASPAQDAVAAVQMSESLEAGEPVSLTPSQPALLRSPSNMALMEPTEYEGLVELTPLGRWGMLDDTQEAPSESWQLDRAILPRLKQVIEGTSEEFAELADTVVDQLFGDGGGMVAIDQVQLPRGLFEIERAFVDVQVESTVMLYRSLELFASGRFETRHAQLSGPILDSIMATLGEVAESEIQPVGDPSPSRLSAIAYPIAAIAATGAAFSARQKSKPLSTSEAHKRAITT